MSRYTARAYPNSLALTHGAGANTTSLTTTIYGRLIDVTYVTPAAVDGAATLTLSVVDADNIAVYSKAGVAANTAAVDYPTNQPVLAGTYTVKAVFSANQTATDTTTKMTLNVI